MRLIRGFHNLRPVHQGSAVTIGNFDGLHRGHRAVLERLHRQVVLVENLAPAVIRGVESQGMLLAASDEAGIAVLSPHRPVQEGSLVK